MKPACVSPALGRSRLANMSAPKSNAVFYDQREAGAPFAPFARFAFCKQTSVLEEAVRRLRTIAG